jgi:hypothetical protein
MILEIHVHAVRVAPDSLYSERVLVLEAVRGEQSIISELTYQGLLITRHLDAFGR